MVIVTWLGVFPIVTIIFYVFGHWLNLLPTLVRTLVFTALRVTLMSYVLMPRLVRLYPDRE
jgi:antibiotic biosynthesis monooxygenase (ABM) superfamily enzyme